MATPLRAAYIDLDNTLLGRNASLFHDADGVLTNLGVRAIEACHRADAEVVIMSGRRRLTVMEDARLLGAQAYIFESGAAVGDGPDEEGLTEPHFPAEDSTVFDQVAETGAPAPPLARFARDLELPHHLERPPDGP